MDTAERVKTWSNGYQWLPKGGSGRKEMKTHTLITGIAVLFLATGAAHAADKCVNPDGTQDPVCAERNDEDWGGETLGYGATLRAAAIAVEAANFDPELRFDEDLYSVFEQRQESALWIDEIIEALSDIEDGPWGSLTKDLLHDL